MEDLKSFLYKLFPTVNFEHENLLEELDSLNLFMLVGALEQEYKISISVDDLTPENFNSVNSIFALITKLSK